MTNRRDARAQVLGLAMASVAGLGLAAFVVERAPEPRDRSAPATSEPRATTAAPIVAPPPAPNVERSGPLASGAPARTTAAAATPTPPSCDASIAPPSAPVPADDLALRSPEHALVLRLLDEHADALAPEPEGFAGWTSPDRERAAREAELVARLHALGPAIAAPLADLILDPRGAQRRELLARALASLDHPDALAAALRVVAAAPAEVGLCELLVRSLPATPAAALGVARAYEGAGHGPARGLLLREYARRIADDDASRAELLRRAAQGEPDVLVRADAITLLGRRGDARDAELLRPLCHPGHDLQVRTRALLALAETAGEGALDDLEAIVGDAGAELAVRAAAVLAIGSIEGERSIATLEHLALHDAEPEVRTRAARLAGVLRARRDAR